MFNPQNMRGADVNRLRKLVQSGDISENDLANVVMAGNLSGNAFVPTREEIPTSQDFVRNESTGSTTFLPRQGSGNGAGMGAGMAVPTYRVVGASGNGAVDLGQEQGALPPVDYTRGGINIAGIGKGYYSRDGRYAIVDDGSGNKTKVLLGYDREASMRATKQNLDLENARANIEQTRAQTAQIGAPNYQLTPEGDVFNPKSGQIESRGQQSGATARAQTKAMFDAGVKELAKDDAQVAGAATLEQAYQEWATLQPQVTTGRIMGHMPAIGQPARQRLEQLQNFLAVNNFKPGQGQISNFERGLIKGAGPNVENDAETNMAIVKIGLGAVQNMKERSNFREAYLQAKGKLLGSDQVWQDYLDKNPRYIRDGAGQIVENADRVGWQQWFGQGGAQQGGVRQDAGVRRYNPQTGRIE